MFTKLKNFVVHLLMAALNALLVLWATVKAPFVTAWAAVVNLFSKEKKFVSDTLLSIKISIGEIEVSMHDVFARLQKALDALDE